MKSILMAINPEWCELIASGKKTVELRKTKPKLETPFKCYIYCTKNGKNIFSDGTTYVTDNSKLLNKDAVQGFEKTSGLHKWNGKVIGEYICDEIFPVKVFENGSIQDYVCYDMELSCVPYEEISAYIGKNNTGYGHHISDIVIYDKPRELSEFCITDNEAVKSCEHREQSYHQFTDTGYIKNGFLCTDKFDWCTKCKTKPITRPPQSWCYVEKVGVLE